MDAIEIKEKLEAEIGKTQKLIETYRELTRPEAPDSAIGRVSRMDAINNRSVMEATLRQSEEKLHDLERVIALYGTPDFGLCQRCRTPIPAGRILFRPGSLFCVNCAR